MSALLVGVLLWSLGIVISIVAHGIRDRGWQALLRERRRGSVYQAFRLPVTCDPRSLPSAQTDGGGWPGFRCRVEDSSLCSSDLQLDPEPASLTKFGFQTNLTAHALCGLPHDG